MSSHAVHHQLATDFGRGLALSSLGGVAFGETFIVKDGQALAELVVAAEAPPMVKLAASELQTYIEYREDRQRMRGDVRELYAFSPTGKEHFHDRMKLAELMLK